MRKYTFQESITKLDEFIKLKILTFENLQIVCHSGEGRISIIFIRDSSLYFVPFRMTETRLV
ncbi:hypothetical protein ACFP3I_10250 [Chryseobacterium arachidis]|uniref:hypothetical protein n=1 Tax=Chryseobacterium arachidis TaxID=1416778 RepID=UPI003624011A